MTPHHAVEITLTRPATASELQRARRRVPLATNADFTRLLVVQQAKSPGRALRVLRHLLDVQLPIDVMTTHYPDRRGQILLNVAVSHAIRRIIRHKAAALGQTPQDFLSQAVTTAVDRHERQRLRHLTDRLEGLLTDNTAEELLLAAADVLSRPHRSGTPSKR
ncbi:hypothetical protein ACIQPQ_17265 [Streptomyces sp. NPDC091281]|uniref:hypothetical protein n=1 Tax=Streptomyces sp. NPDC091281 TaxID=3365985 RepID=UPI003810F3CF